MPTRIHEMIRRTLDHAGPEGRAEAALVAMVRRFARGSTEAEVREALTSLAEAGAIVRQGDRWIRPQPPTEAPTDAASLHELERRGLRLPALSAGAIDLTVDLPETEDQPLDPADRARLEANLANVVASAPHGADGRRNLGPGPALLDRLFEGVPRSAPPPPPAPEQVEAAAWLVRNADRVAATIADAFRDDWAPGPRPRSGRFGEDGNVFLVEQVRVRLPERGRSLLVLTGWCGWDREHGFAITLDGDEVITAGPASDATA